MGITKDTWILSYIVCVCVFYQEPLAKTAGFNNN